MNISPNPSGAYAVISPTPSNAHSAENPSWGSLRPVLGLALLGALLRAMAVPEFVGDVDSVNFARSLVHFDPMNQSPHMPGYPVFVWVAKFFYGLGVHHEAWALALGGIVLWPLAGVLFYLGSRRWLGHWAALGALTVASVAPAPVVIGGWPASDGLGLALLLAALGALGLAWECEQKQKLSGNMGWAWLGGFLLGLILGVRLSWAPLTFAVVFSFVLRKRAVARSVMVAKALGVVTWFVPLAAWIGWERFFLACSNFAAGHFGIWGGTALATSATQFEIPSRVGRSLWSLWSAGLGAGWPGKVPMSNVSGAFEPGGLILGIIIALALVGWLRTRRHSELLLIAAPYFIWVVGLQNVEKFRHLVPLLPLLGAMLFTGIQSWRWPRGLAAVFMVFMLLATTTRAWEQGSRPVASVSMVSWAMAHHPPGGILIFAGQEARVFEHHAPHLRVLRPANVATLRREANRVSALGVQVWVSSGAPGVELLTDVLKELKSFRSSVEVQAHDHHLTLYKYVGAI